MSSGGRVTELTYNRSSIAETLESYLLNGRSEQHSYTGVRVLRAPQVENDAWMTFRSHYSLDALYSWPGKDGAHEKDEVEARSAGSAIIA